MVHIGNAGFQKQCMNNPSCRHQNVARSPHVHTTIRFETDLYYDRRRRILLPSFPARLSSGSRGQNHISSTWSSIRSLRRPTRTRFDRPNRCLLSSKTPISSSHHHATSIKDLQIVTGSLVQVHPSDTPWLSRSLPPPLGPQPPRLP